MCRLRRLEEREAGQDQVGILARGDTYRDQATLHHYYQVPDTILQLTVDGMRRLPRQDYCHVGMQPAAAKEDKIMTEKEPIAKRGRKADKKEEKNKSEEDLEEKSNYNSVKLGL